ncbi:MAG TPA: hypothetical protein P5067_09525 [Candidatus Marinimicrobia bacterium]|nr:hypothetical protein [Candidatus Neomarinimicrobiota bacterium]
MSLLQNNLKKFKWPDKELEIFKSDFDWWNQASLDYYSTDEKLSIYAEGYKEAGDIVSKWVNDNKILQDALIYPIVFLYRQYIELVLKDIIGFVNKKNRGKYEYPNSHNLMELWSETKEILKKFNEINPEDLIAVENILKQISKQDPYSVAFRYPTYRDGNSTIEDLKSINIRNLSEVVDALHSFFLGISCFIEETFDLV